MALNTRGWEALLRLRFADRAGRTRVVARERRGPLALQRPFYPEGSVCHAYLLHPPGGVVGSDSLDIRLHVEAGAQALVTTPGATKFYRSGGRLATQVQTLSVEAGGLLEWLPQENIFFPDAQARVETRVELAAGGRFIGWDIQCLGRPVIDEAFDKGEVNALTRVAIDGRLLLVDQMRTRGRDLVDAPAGMRGCPMQATMLIIDGEAPEHSRETLLAQVRDALARAATGIEAGATCVDGIVVVRLLGLRTEPMLRVLSEVWARARPLVAGREAVAPRIWAT
jgi:urease accessory protein